MLIVLPMLVAMGGVLREHGHKTWIAWAIVGVAVVVGMLGRFYRGRR
jgi:membrane protein DedA with SNARE-associated domain